MTDQAVPMPTPQPNDGSLNTELPTDTQTAVPPKSPPVNKRPIILGILGLFAAAGLVYTITSYPQNYTARGKNKGTNAITQQVNKTATPTATITKTVEQELDAIDLGDIDSEVRSINEDLNSL